MAYLGLVTRRQCWRLTVRGWILLFISLAAIPTFAVTNVHRFLAENHPVRADILVVEGWLPDYALEKAVSEFNQHSYRLLVVTGGPLRRGFFLSKWRTNAELAATTLKRLGLNEEFIVAVPTRSVKKDRTYASAMALKKWLLSSNLSVTSLNIYSLGLHARRSRLIFEKALGDKIAVGVISSNSVDYDPQSWWRSSNGVRAVLDEVIAYCYARLFFYPEDDIE